jgi:hypothetical protein
MARAAYLKVAFILFDESDRSFIDMTRPKDFEVGSQQIFGRAHAAFAWGFEPGLKLCSATATGCGGTLARGDARATRE